MMRYQPPPPLTATAARAKTAREMMIERADARAKMLKEQKMTTTVMSNPGVASALCPHMQKPDLCAKCSGRRMPTQPPAQISMHKKILQPPVEPRPKRPKLIGHTPTGHKSGQISTHANPKNPANPANPATAPAPPTKRKREYTDDELEDRRKQFKRVLQEGANDIPGIMATHDADGKELEPFEHQRQAVKRALPEWVRFFFLAHDPGLGKTATIAQLIAAMEITKRNADGELVGGVRAIISVPPITMEQWYDCFVTWFNQRVSRDEILVTNRTNNITREALQKARFVVISRSTIAHIYKTCFEQPIADRARGEAVARKGTWRRKPGVPLHPLYEMEWDLFAVDEAHFARNPSTVCCVAHAELAKKCKKRVASTATPIFNDPNDMRGLSMVIGADGRDVVDRNGRRGTVDFRSKTAWTGVGEKRTKLNLETVEEFRRHTDRQHESILNLPPLTHTVFDFTPDIDEENVKRYNALLENTKLIRVELERDLKNANSERVAEFNKLTCNLTKLQQMLVSPRLANKGAKYCDEHPEEYDLAAAEETGALRALLTRINTFSAEGHERIIVACDMTAPMKIGRRYLERHLTGYEMFMYDGTLNVDARQHTKRNFLTSPKAIMFLSISAGGTGVHLVPGCTCMIFWGARPYAPAQVLQCSKRIHRIGQEFPVKIDHIIARGSVDDAIQRVGTDKQNLSDAVLNGNFRFADKNAQMTKWKRTKRIIDMCSTMDEQGRFVTISFNQTKKKAPPALPSSRKFCKKGKQRVVGGPGMMKLNNFTSSWHPGRA